MVTRTWQGANADFNNPAQWSPSGVPATGDTAIVQTGTVHLQDQGLSGVNFSLRGESLNNAPTLSLQNVALSSSNIDLPVALDFKTYYGHITVQGTVVDLSNITAFGYYALQANLSIGLQHHSSFVDVGNITLGESGRLTVNGPKDSTFSEDGLSTLGGGGYAVINTRVFGTGTFQEVMPGPRAGNQLEFGDSVSAGITVKLEGDLVQSNVLRLDAPDKFLGTLDITGQNDIINLPNISNATVQVSPGILDIVAPNGQTIALHTNDLTGYHVSTTPGPGGQGTNILISDPPSGTPSAGLPMSQQQLATMMVPPHTG